MKTTRSTKRSFRPSVEALESREVPTVSAFTVASNPGVLFVVGDSGANNVQILQNDNANTIRVIGDGQTRTFTSTEITTITVALDGPTVNGIPAAATNGNDTVVYRLDGGSNFRFAKMVGIDLGNGTNSATVDLQNNGQGGQATIEAPVTILIRSLGSVGPINFNHLPGSKVDNVVVNLGAIDEDAAAVVDINLGIGDDVATVNQTGTMCENARLDIRLDDAPAFTEILNRPTGTQRFRSLGGNDTFSVNLDGDVPDSRGVVNVNMFGRHGNDTLSLTQRGELDGTMTINIMGGAGNDTLSATLALEEDSEGSLSLTMLGQVGNIESVTALVDNFGDLASFTRTILP